MSKRQIEYLLKLNIPLVIVNILVFSEGFLGLRFKGSSTLEQSIFLTVLLTSLFLAIYGNYKILCVGTKIKSVDIKNLKTSAEFIEVFEGYTNINCVSKSINLIISQLKELEVRRESLKNTLLQYFLPDEMTFIEFSSAIESSISIFYKNLEKIINRINFLDSIKASKYNIGDEEKTKDVLSDIDRIIKQNADILNELYNLNYAICKLDSKNDIENSNVLEEIRKITKNVNLYD